ncbi:MAG: PBS lyase [Candidatus Fervidibacterota bacterium]
MKNEPRTFTAKIPCGGGEHEVTITLPEQGNPEIFSPCRDLPETARKLSKSDCLDHLYERVVGALLRHEDRKIAIEALVKIGEPAVEPLIEALRDRDWEVRWAAAYALGKIGKPAVEPLIEALRDRDGKVRRAAADALGAIGDARAVEPLIEALRDRDWEVREAAVNALGKIAVEALRKLMMQIAQIIRRITEGRGVMR